MSGQSRRPPGIFLARSKNFSPEEDHYFSVMKNKYGLGGKIVTILMTVKKIFYNDIPDDRITLDMLHSACAYLLHDPGARVYVTFGSQGRVSGAMPGAVNAPPPVSQPATEGIEEIEPKVGSADYSMLSKDELSHMFEM